MNRVKLVISLVVVCVMVITTFASANSAFYYTSSPNNWVGGGDTVSLSFPTTSIFAEVRRNSNGSWVYLLAGDVYMGYILQLQAPGCTAPTEGFYSDATKFPFNNAVDGAGISFANRHLGRNDDERLTGNFNVLQADYDSNGKLVSFAVDFTEYEVGTTTDWMSGSFRYNSNIPIPEPATLLLFGLGGMFLRRRANRR
jgi:hypothetical protein